MDANTSQVVTSVASTAGVVLVAWIAYKQAQLNKKMGEVKDQTDGILAATTKARDKAEGAAEAAVEIAVAIKPPA